MSTELLTIVIVVLTAAVVVGLFTTMWVERRSPAEARAAIVAGAALAIWAVLDSVLALRGVYLPPPSGPPPVAICLLVEFVLLTAALASSRTLRSLLSNQRNLIRLNLWRVVGFVFLLLMAKGQMPAVWALPAGIGDIIVGLTAFWVADQFNKPNGRRLAVGFNLFGLADLIVAVGLGTATSPGPTQLIRTTPTAELATHFPLVLVPTFLVPLAFALHIISLWQIFRGSWRSDSTTRSAF